MDTHTGDMYHFDRRRLRATTVAGPGPLDEEPQRGGRRVMITRGKGCVG